MSKAKSQSRRETPLLGTLRDDIQKRGPLSIKRYMRACLFDAEYGYYKNARVLGRDGDFITAPEISQTFGELIGLWCVAVWQQMGAPEKLQLVELGPGRGTLMADALRAGRTMPEFFGALSIVMFETHPGLREAQTKTLASFVDRITWHTELDALECLPTIVIANEFLDCIPIEQFVATRTAQHGWQRRCVDLDDDGNLKFVLCQIDPAGLETLAPTLRGFDATSIKKPDGAIIETRDVWLSGLKHLCDTFAQHQPKPVPFAGLFIDYGHTKTSFGDTLQAVRNHAFEDPLTSPGEADLTAHVDFEQFAQTMHQNRLACDGPVSQGAFLTALGVVQRGRALAEQNPALAAGIELAIARLISPTGMGSRFHAIGLRTPNVPPLPGLTA